MAILALYRFFQVFVIVALAVLISNLFHKRFFQHSQDMSWTAWGMIASLALFIIWVLSETFGWANAIMFKIRLIIYGQVNFIVSRDNKFKQPSDPDSMSRTGSTKRIIFIRHGESAWNLIFNRGVMKLIPRLLMGLYREFCLLVTRDSIFYDSPLNQEGIEQAETLLIHIERPPVQISPEIAEALCIMRGEGAGGSVIVSSNLRRAIGTTSIGLLGRLRRTGEKIHILSSCQEISRNVDTLSLATSPDAPLTLTRTQAFLKSRLNLQEAMDTSENKGNKPLRGTGFTRLMEFCEWAFERKEDTIIVGGHSLWFRSFFQMFLPAKSEHVAKTCKIKNSGVISFTLQQGVASGGKPQYRIEPSSMCEVFLGFDMSKLKTKKK